MNVMDARKGSKVYVVDDNPGRAGSFSSDITLWESPRDAALVFLAGNRGHTLKGSPAAEGMELRYRNPQYPDKEYYVTTTEDELTRLAIKLQFDGYLDPSDGKAREPSVWDGDDEDEDEFEEEEFDDDLDDDRDEDDGQCVARRMEVR